MVRLSDLLRGYALIRCDGAEPARLLDICTVRNISFWAADPIDELSLELCIRLEDVSKVMALADEARCELTLLNKRGAPLKIMQARRRAVMWTLPVLLLSLLVLASMFTWSIEISGNENVEDPEILNALEESGVFLGSFHPAYTSDSIRSRVMVQIPELKWIGIRVYGSRADVLVRERTDIPELYDKKEAVNVFAAYPGVIEQLRAFNGKPQFIKGQTVAKGDLLISGAMPSTQSPTIIRHARGEVIARTWHEITAVMPLEYTAKAKTGGEEDRWALKLGDKRINFYSSSGITGAMCDNIIKEYKLGIDGLFTLPVSLLREKTIAYKTCTAQISENAAKTALKQRAEAELSRRIGEKGEVISQNLTFSMSGSCMVATLLAECRQDIAAEKPMTEAELAQVRQENTALEEESTQ